VPGTTGTNVSYFAAGAVVAGLLVGAFTLLKSSQEEERPPIIVRGGSLIFESGDRNSSKPKEKHGKKWMNNGGNWQPDHGNGISVSDLTVAIRGGNQASCPALDRVPGDPNAGAPPVITVTYKAGSTETSVTITAQASGKKWIPTIQGSDLRQENDTTDNPQLVFGTHGQGEISRVQFRGQNGNVNCQGPITSLKVWQDK